MEDLILEAEEGGEEVEAEGEPKRKVMTFASPPSPSDATSQLFLFKDTREARLEECSCIDLRCCFECCCCCSIDALLCSVSCGSVILR